MKKRTLPKPRITAPVDDEDRVFSAFDDETTLFDEDRQTYNELQERHFVNRKYKSATQW